MHVARVFEVTTRPAGSRVREGARKQRKMIEGRLAALPRVGESIVVFRDDKMSRLITSTVIRILSGPDGSLYAETRNSVYRVVVAAEPRVTR